MKRLGLAWLTVLLQAGCGLEHGEMQGEMIDEVTAETTKPLVVTTKRSGTVNGQSTDAGATPDFGFNHLLISDINSDTGFTGLLVADINGDRFVNDALSAGLASEQTCKTGYPVAVTCCSDGQCVTCTWSSPGGSMCCAAANPTGRPKTGCRNE